MHEPRDKSGPMDVDQTHPLGRLAQYAVGYEDGPARKRLHSDLSSPVSDPFASTGTATTSGSGSGSVSGFKFGPNTPFLFHSPPISLPPTPKFEPYDPNRWARTDFGFGTGAAAAAAAAAGRVSLDDVEMQTDSPARPLASSCSTTPAVAAAAVAETTASSAVTDAGADVRPIAGGAVARVRRMRQKEWARRRRRADTDTEDDDDDDDDTPGSLARRGRSQAGITMSEHHYNLSMSAPAVRHSEIPAILLGYVQFVFNASLVLGFLYIAVQFILAVRRDVQERTEEYSAEILQEIAGCTTAYLTNRCEPSLRVPAMEAACSAWEMCMNRDPTVVGRARVGAETFAGVINSFVEPISWKTMSFTLVTLTFLIILTNSDPFNVRAKHQSQQQQSHLPPPSQHQPQLQGMYGPQGYYPPPALAHGYGYGAGPGTGPGTGSVEPGHELPKAQLGWKRKLW